MKRIVLDLDETLTMGRPHNGETYADVKPCKEMIEKVREYKRMGFDVIISTSRNMRTYNNSVGQINAKTLPVIIEWLKRYNVPYDEIYVGKPWCGNEGFHVDDKAIRPREFLDLSYEEICRLIRIAN